MARKDKVSRQVQVFRVNGKTLSRASLSDLLSLTAADIGKLNVKQSVQLEKRLYKAAEARLKTIYAHGYRSILAEYNFGAEHPTKPVEHPTVYATKHRVTALHDFLKNEKSTYTGLRKYYQKEELRIFKKKGAGFKNEEERTRFWHAYEEFMHQNPSFLYESNRVQQFLGRETFWRSRDFNAADFNSLLVALQGEDTEVDIRADIGYEPDI